MKRFLLEITSIVVLSMIVAGIMRLLGLQPNGYTYWQSTLYYVVLFSVVEILRYIIKKFNNTKQED